MTYNANISGKQGGNYTRVGGLAGFPVEYKWDDLLFARPTPNHVVEFNDFFGDAIPAYWTEAANNSGTVAINAQRGGVVRFTTGTTSTNHATLAAGLHWRVSNGFTFFSARVASISALTTRTIEVGLTDATTETNGLVLSAHTATPTAVADNALIFGYDTGAPMTTWGIFTVNATVAAARTLVTQAPVAGTFQRFDIIVNASGKAWFYIDGTLVSTVTSAVATSAVLTPWVGITTLAASAAIADCDYAGAVGVRG